MFQVAELEGRNRELSKERDELFREYDKTRKELATAQAKADRKTKKDAEKAMKKRLPDTHITCTDQTGMYKVRSGWLNPTVSVYAYNM